MRIIVHTDSGAEYDLPATEDLVCGAGRALGGNFGTETFTVPTDTGHVMFKSSKIEAITVIDK